MTLLSIMLKFRRLLKRGEICSVTLCVAAGVLIGGGIRYGCFADFAKYVVSRVQHIDSTCVPAVGLSRCEMLERFDGARMYVLLEYDKSLKCDIARWYYRIGDSDSDVFFTFKYSYKTGKIVEWKMQRDYGFYNWDFTDYLRPADMKTEPELVITARNDQHVDYH